MDPLIVEEPSTTTLVHPGQSLTVDRAGNLAITALRATSYQLSGYQLLSGYRLSAISYR